MDLSILTPAQKKAWQAMTEYMKKNPEANETEAKRETGITSSTFYAARKRLGLARGRTSKRKYTRRNVVMHTLPVDETPHTSETVVAFIGNSKSVVNSVREFLR